MMEVMMSMEDIHAAACRLNVNLDSLDLSSIHLPTDEYMYEVFSDTDDEDLNEEFGNIIVVDGLPVVAQDKFEKLERHIRKIFGKYGVINMPVDPDTLDIMEGGLYMPVDPDTLETLGYCFIEFNTPQEAELAKEETNGYMMDKNHIISVNVFDDIDKFMKVQEEWTPPEPKPYTPRENLQKWLTDEKARDQFVIRAGSDTEVVWNDVRQSMPELAYKRTQWTDSYVQWSPLGTYLATVHKQGAKIWGGATTFGPKGLMRYDHPQVKLIDFSPGEKFLVTYSSHEPSNSQDTLTVVINIFDVRTGKVMRNFKGSAVEFAIGGAGGLYSKGRPLFRWGGGMDDTYFAKIGKNAISIYETETFTLIDKKSLKVENVVDFCWSPTDPVLALFVPELGGGNQPARVSLVQIPSKVEIRQKNLFSVSDCKMYWQSNGDYLAVKVDRYTKTKKSTYTGFELFRIKERDIPIEVLELENKNDKIIAFAWEPKGHRFAVIHGDNPRPDVSFYTMHGGRASKLTSLKGKANALYWSPTGRFIILAGLKKFNGQLEFYDVDELETMAVRDHYNATDVEWDPTGRYVMTAVTAVHGLDNGFNVWSFHGNLLYRIERDHFFQFAWRPRPPLSFLCAEKEEEIAKNLKKYSKKYEEEDKDDHEKDRLKRRMLKDAWDMWISKWKRMHEEDRLEMQKLRDGEESEEEEEFEAKEVEIEEILHVLRRLSPTSFAGNTRVQFTKETKFC